MPWERQEVFPGTKEQIKPYVPTPRFYILVNINAAAPCKEGCRAQAPEYLELVFLQPPSYPQPAYSLELAWGEQRHLAWSQTLQEVCKAEAPVG